MVNCASEGQKRLRNEINKQNDKDMNRLIKTIQAGKFAWEKYLNGKTWYGMKLHTRPLFCSYGQIGYTVAVFSGNAHTLTITHDWEMNTTKYEYA